MADVLAETWGLWQPWSQCSATCGDGVRERRRLCLTSFPSRPGCPGMPSESSRCSLEECAVFQPSSPSPLQPQGPVKSNNIVTITGISLCLFIIVATVLITLWRKFGRPPKCGTPARHNSIHSPSFRKNSDEENICELSEQRGSFSDAEDNPPLFSYRLAQQQLKEMKKKGLTETTKVYHVSQSPLTDTAIDGATLPADLPLDPESPEDAAANRFRIKSPFLEQPAVGAGEGPPSRLDGPVSQASCAVSPSQTLIRKSQVRHMGSRGGLSERSHPRSLHFRRTASFHETKQARPFRERSMSTLTPRQAPAYSAGPGPGTRQETDGDLRVGVLSCFPRNGTVSKEQVEPCRKDRCQSFPAHPEFAFYDNTSFGLTEAEQRMLDLPGYFGSNEEDETTSTLSVEKLVI
ncbi:hypothetical protein QTO34_016925 [Cnephaeus nilssonii]|uniref:Thrombospondin type-1 domain-containing protein 1 n=1 Tax=Cnephaeus nilssonii TaxID=3371016 RepID=A0AA40I351_CNENI|nr:hypothetical protein QTO34_016925 [Eptesicus nilssonii]